MTSQYLQSKKIDLFQGDFFFVNDEEKQNSSGA